jgi:hypothetical protein
MVKNVQKYRKTFLFKQFIELTAMRVRRTNTLGCSNSKHTTLMLAIEEMLCSILPSLDTSMSFENIQKVFQTDSRCLRTATVYIFTIVYLALCLRLSAPSHYKIIRKQNNYS